MKDTASANMTLDIENLRKERMRPGLAFYDTDPSHQEPAVDSPLLHLPSAQTYRENLKDLRAIFTDAVCLYTEKPPSSTTVPRRFLYADMSPLILFRFGSQTDLSDRSKYDNIDTSYLFWERLAQKILTEQNPENVMWDGNRPIISGQYLNDQSDGVAASYQPYSAKMRIGSITFEISDWLIGKVAGAQDYFEFPDPNIFYSFAAQGFLDTFGREIVMQITRAGLLKIDMLPKSVPVLSCMAEEIFNKYPLSFFSHFMHGIVSGIGGEEGFGVAAAILEDLAEIYKPAFAHPKGRYSVEQKSLFKKTLVELYERYNRYRYATRPDVISPYAREEAFQAMQEEPDPSRKLYAYLEKIFTGIGAPERFGDIFNLQDQNLIRWIYEGSLQEKKMEAGQIPIMADILGFDNPERLVWITNLMQILWKAILTHDDTVDQTPLRRGNKTLYVKEGMAMGIQQPLLTIIKSVRAITEKQGINNNHLSRAVLTMLDRLYSAEVSKPNIGWDSDFSELENNMIDIMQVLAWFPRYTVQREGLPTKVRLAGEKLAQYLEHYGCLVLIKNDCEDILEDTSHAAGDDIGVRVNTFMHNLYNNPEIPAAEREEFRILCEDPIITAKKRRFEQLDENDNKKISRALEIGRKYKHLVVGSLLSSIRNYREARILLDEALIYDYPVNDKRNRQYHQVFAEALDNLWEKLESYTVESSQTEVKVI